MSGPQRTPVRAALRMSWRAVELSFAEDTIQTRMARWAPHRLVVPYTRGMLAALWLQPRPQCIGIIGLGGGAQAKFCHRYLPWARVEAVEADPQVLALRDVFRLPRDDARLEVSLDDGAAWIAHRPQRYDLLLLDAYDADGIPPALCTTAFYAACQAALRPGGVLVLNLFQVETAEHLGTLRKLFDGHMLVLPEPDLRNQIVFCWEGKRTPGSVADALRRLPWSAARQLRPSMQRLQAAWTERAWRFS
ncbi:transferase [Xanthomonas campestris]|uniref:spermine/spermidine synthase domain-containing protein n=1 Tax=Xanthomonas campestris TaxID=339 RepID=UPI0023685C98|nr:transferase [Xanthomonas campestris]MDM7586013.1 transferase [Xanthomonas campestris]MDM7593357.1 transferase [Xanthomonas campestris]MEA9865393.1 transferase [Xanthomonas campestris pv. raphani]MEB1797217.1 transferase [Xanthomonas campestris pv. campestris]WDK81698.1 transferase [Xanthomonas campestris pv. campestris]